MPISEKQYDAICDSTARLNILEGPVRSGKSFAANMRWIEFVEAMGARPPGVPFLMTGKTQETAVRNLVNPILSLVPSKASYKKGCLSLFGHECEVWGVNDDKAAGKIQGATYSGWLGDEASLYPLDFFNMARTRLSPRGAAAFLTTNPDSPFHYLKKEWMDKRALHHCNVFTFRIEDNPSLDAEYVESLKRDYTGVFYRRYILGEWCIAEGVIYPNWDAVRNHLHSPLPRRDCFVVSIDYGTTNPCVFGKYQLSGNTWGRVDEYYWDSAATQRQKSDDEYLQDFEKFVGRDVPEVVLIDPSAASFACLLEQEGYNVIRAENDVIDGIRTMAAMISRGDFKVMAEQCPEFMREISVYCWDAKASLRGEDKPLKKNDHCMDEARYFCMWAAGKTTGGASPTMTEPDPVPDEAAEMMEEMMT